MNSLRSAAIVLILAGIAAILSLPPLIARHFDSVASLAFGTDDGFATGGLEPRENQVGGGALRWTRPSAAFTFEGAGPGLVDLELEARDHRTEVLLTVNGARVELLRPGRGASPPGPGSPGRRWFSGSRPKGSRPRAARWAPSSSRSGSRRFHPRAVRFWACPSACGWRYAPSP